MNNVEQHSVIPEEPEQVNVGIAELLSDTVHAHEGRIPQLLTRIHKHCGHPSTTLMQKILVEAKPPPPIIVGLVANIDCPVCARMRKVTPARPVNPRKDHRLGGTIYIGFSHHELSPTSRVQVFHVIDEASQYHTSKIALHDSGNVTSKQVVALLQDWVSVIGYPSKIKLDEEGYFHV